MTSAAFAGDATVGTVFEESGADLGTLRESAPAVLPVAGRSARSAGRLWLHDFTIVSLLAGVQFSWIMVLAYGLYWLVT